MKIILINASPRKNGATAKILSEFVRQLEPRGDVMLSLIHLADLKLAFCDPSRDGHRCAQPQRQLK